MVTSPAASLAALHGSRSGLQGQQQLLQQHFQQHLLAA
jgi:hypothetical protein